MGLDQIVDIQQRTSITETGEPQEVFEVEFTTEKTAGSKTLDIPVDDFTRDKARRMASERAEELDAAIGGNEE